VFVAFAAAAILTLATGAMAFSTFLFDDDGSGSIERSVLPALIPNVVVITLLFLGGNRLLEHHADGRWLLAVAAVLDAGISAGWAIFLDAGDAGAVVLAAAWLLAPAVLAALLAWTPGARRWTSRPLS
jgi:Flp pilus assembly pilin Flp